MILEIDATQEDDMISQVAKRRAARRQDRQDRLSAMADDLIHRYGRAEAMVRASAKVRPFVKASTSRRLG